MTHPCIPYILVWAPAQPKLRIFRAQLLTNTSSNPRIFQRKTSLLWGLLYRTHIIEDYGAAKLNPVYINTALCSKKSPFHLYLGRGRSSSWTCRALWGGSDFICKTLQGRRRFLKPGFRDCRTSQQSSTGKLQVGVEGVKFYLSENKILHVLVLNKWKTSIFWQGGPALLLLVFQQILWPCFLLETDPSSTFLGWVWIHPYFWI